MDKMKMQTSNIVDENVGFIESRFPNCIVEARDEDGNLKKMVDFDVLKQELSKVVVDGDKERYQMTWPDKRKAILTANAPINATLRPCREESVDFDNTKNLYIEGDNLDVLKLLRETYLGKVKMIYIDPPYNTGNDFVYNDDFAESTEEYVANSGQFDDQGNRLVQNTESNGRFHTDWLNMIYPRLKVAKDLLSDDGVIFISIDDNEYDNLRKVADEVFGAGCFVTTLHIELSATQGMKVKAAKEGNIVKNAEYILVYSKSGIKSIAKTLLYDYRPDYDEHYSYILDENEPHGYTTLKNKYNKTLSGSLSDEYRTNLDFKEFVDNHVDIIFRFDKTTGFKKEDFKEGLIYKDFEHANRTYWLYNNGISVNQLMFLKASFGECDDYYHNKGLRKIRGDWWKEFYLDMGNVSKEGDMPYRNGKKPVRLIQQIVKMCTVENDIIMDFFSGSATTAHAVMKQNVCDCFNRHFVMVQLPETISEDESSYKGMSTICDIGKERIRRAGKRIKDECGLTAQNLDVGFRVFKLDSSNMKDTYYKPSDYDMSLLDTLDENIKPDRTPEDLLFQVMLDLGLMLDSKIETKQINGKKVFIVGDYNEAVHPDLVCCFDSDVSNDTVTEIAKMKPKYAVFRDSSMSTDSVAVNFDQLFETYSPSTTRKVL